MEGSVEDLGAPESWEMADLDESMSRLMVSCKKNSTTASSSSGFMASEFVDESATATTAATGSSSSSALLSSVDFQRIGGGSEDAIDQVDQFLIEALQNPRERLSILRMEQDVEKFIHDPSQQQLEFQQLPTSYLRLAAHRVAQHYYLQSMVVLDNNVPDGSGTRIVVQKSSECRLPLIRLADIPVNLQQEESDSVVKVAIKQRPQKHSHTINSANQHSSKASHLKSVEERKEEYNKARARIFSPNNSSGGTGGKPECEPTVQDSFQQFSLGSTRVEDKSVIEGSEINFSRDLGDSFTGSSRSSRSRTEKEPVGRYNANNRVAIFRDREVDRKDPDYDRSYDRYAQRFDPGFGFNRGSYSIQPMYSPVLNYNSEFPQLGSTHRSHISIEHQLRPIPQQLPWAPAPGSNHAGIGYGPPDTMMPPFNPNHVGAPSTSAIYLPPSQYPYPHPGMPFVNPHEHIHQPFAQPRQQQPEASSGLARPR